MYYVLKHDESGPHSLGRLLATLSREDAIPDAVRFIERDFHGIDARGPRDVCRFLGRGDDDNLAADVLAFRTEFVGGYREGLNDTDSPA